MRFHGIHEKSMKRAMKVTENQCKLIKNQWTATKYLKRNNNNNNTDANTMQQKQVKATKKATKSNEKTMNKNDKEL